jgi:hypothetical protein
MLKLSIMTTTRSILNMPKLTILTTTHSSNAETDYFGHNTSPIHAETRAILDTINSRHAETDNLTTTHPLHAENDYFRHDTFYSSIKSYITIFSKR